MATIYATIAVEVEVPDEDIMDGYDDNPVQWTLDNVKVDIEAPNFDWWIDNVETVYDD